MTIAVACLFAMLTSAAAVAQSGVTDYPIRPVRLVIPYAAGGAPDVIARMMAQPLAETLGQNFVVDNHPGAGGITAAEIVAKSPPDGYTLLIPDITQTAINPFLFSHLPYDPAKDFAPISLLALTPMYIVAQASLKVTTVPQLTSLAKARPGQLNYGSAGIGSIHHIAMESFKRALGLDIVHVPYKGSGQSVPAFVSGDVTLVITTLNAIAPYLISGQGKALAVTSLHRSPAMPDVPPVSDFIPDYAYTGEIGALAPAGTPPAIIRKLASAMSEALKRPDVVKRLDAIGYVALASTPEQYAENLRGNLERFEKAVKLSGARAD